ncbi:MAG: zinc-ribbon domain-containing protein [Actinomycetia bacterium]|nr:zinc-ribbon domain-containing protein [Actinomycetes bacterium]
MARVLLPIAVIVIALAASYLVQRQRGYQYRCPSCGTRFRVSPTAAIVAPHRLGGEKLVRCPRCHAMRWAAPSNRYDDAV